MTDNTTFVATQVPYLRRFSRVLTGSQTVADSCVQAMLEAMIKEPPFRSQADARRWLYRTLVALWIRIENNDARLTDTVVSSVDLNLMAIAPSPRAAFLLQSMEEFGLDEISDILQQCSTDTESLITQAGVELVARMRTSVLIIEDEPIISMDLQILVEQLGHNVSHIARTHQEAVGSASRFQPGLVLADVHIAEGGSGIDAANAIITSYDVPVIFITAFPNQFKLATPTIVVTKPYRAATMKAAISRALFFDIHA